MIRPLLDKKKRKKNKSLGLVEKGSLQSVPEIIANFRSFFLAVISFFHNFLVENDFLPYEIKQKKSVPEFILIIINFFSDVTHV